MVVDWVCTVPGTARLCSQTVPPGAAARQRIKNNRKKNLSILQIPSGTGLGEETTWSPRLSEQKRQLLPHPFQSKAVTWAAWERSVLLLPLHSMDLGTHGVQQPATTFILNTTPQRRPFSAGEGSREGGKSSPCLGRAIDILRLGNCSGLQSRH